MQYDMQLSGDAITWKLWLTQYVDIPLLYQYRYKTPVASFIQEVNPWLTKAQLVFNGRLDHWELTSLVKDAKVVFSGQPCHM